jgi:hypothetical protein
LQKLPPLPAADDFVLGHAQAPQAQAVKQIDNFPVPERLGTPVIARTMLNSDELRALKNRCRLEGATINSAFTAALLLSEQTELKSGGPVSALEPVGIRHLSPRLAETFGLYISSGIVSRREEPDGNFWGLARSIKKQLMPALDVQLLATWYAAFRSVVLSRPSPLEAYTCYRQGVTYRFVFSNTGRLPFEPQIGPLRVDAIWPIPNVEIEPFVSSVTVGGRMFITAVGVRSMQKLLDRAVGHIRASTREPVETRGPKRSPTGHRLLIPRGSRRLRFPK